MSLPQSFRQYRLTQPGSLSADNFKIQETKCAPLKANEVAVKIHAVSLNFRDIEIANNTYAAKTKTNLVPGSDMAGEIVSIGSDVRCWKQGQRVYASFALDHLYGDTSPRIADTYLGSQNQDGVLAEYRNFPEHSLVEIPDYLSYEEASTIPCSALTAYNCLLGAKPLKGGDYVLILGTGGVSVFAIQIAVASGATALVVSSSDDKLKTAQKLGAQHVINYEKVQDWAKEIHKITGGRGVDHVIEVGGAGTLRQSLEAVRYGGYVHLVGYVTHKGEQTKDSISLEEMLTKAIFKTVNLRGIQIGSIAQFQDMNRLFAAKCIKPVVDKVFNFDDVVSAYKYFESQKHEGKVVIRVGK